MLPFIKKQPNGLQTLLYSEGQHIPGSIAKRIVLARAIVHNPELLVLKDPLENFEQEEAQKIIEYLTNTDHPWSIMISSRNPLWRKHCSKIIYLNNGTLIDITNA